MGDRTPIHPHPPPKADQGLGALGRLLGASGLLRPYTFARVSVPPPYLALCIPYIITLHLSRAASSVRKFCKIGRTRGRSILCVLWVAWRGRGVWCGVDHPSARPASRGRGHRWNIGGPWAPCAPGLGNPGGPWDCGPAWGLSVLLSGSRGHNGTLLDLSLPSFIYIYISFFTCASFFFRMK